MSENEKAGNSPGAQTQEEPIPHQTLEVEIINPDGTREKVNPGGGRRWRATGRGQNMYGSAWNFAPMDNSGCVAAFLTCFLFLVCLAQFGALAGIGFLVFHTVGSIMGSVHFARRLMRGLPANIWLWRVGNWVVSFFLVALLSGSPR